MTTTHEPDSTPATESKPTRPTPNTAAPQGPPHRAGWGAVAVAVLAAAVAAVGVWWPLLGGAVAGVLPAAVLGALVAAGVLRVRGAVLVVAWCGAALLIAGVPARWLWPTHWAGLGARLLGGVQQVPTLAQESADSRWPLAAWLVLAGTMLLAGAAMTALAPRIAIVRVAGFLLVLMPWAAGTALRQADEPAWLGAVVLLAMLLWWAPSGPRSRSALVPVVALATAVALVALTVTQVVGPRRPWLRLHRPPAAEPRFTTLTTRQTYGPLTDKRTGATMLEIAASQPALWRMQVLERFGYRGWEVGLRDDEPDLPQPAATAEDIQVAVKGLRQDLVVSPGRVLSVATRGEAADAEGEAMRIEPPPGPGQTYRVQAEVVQAGPADLRKVQPSTDPRLEPYTTVFQGYGRPGGLVGRFGQTPALRAGRMEPSGPRFGPFQQVIDLAARLASGAKTPFEVVERVQHYLVDSGVFHYTTDVSDAGMAPLVDFLTRTHSGYCQHFAGAAALLLRLAGVPTRVVAGFATGESDGAGHYRVRDLDAHAWIEVYFPGYGWVPFNPTPGTAPAAVAAQVDPLAATTPGGGWTDRLAAPRRRDAAGAPGPGRRGRRTAARPPRPHRVARMAGPPGGRPGGAVDHADRPARAPGRHRPAHRRARRRGRTRPLRPRPGVTAAPPPDPARPRRHPRPRPGPHPAAADPQALTPPGPTLRA